MNEDLVADSGYVVPHGVMAMHGKVIAPMIGAATDSTAPGGLVELDDKTGEFERYFGPGPSREPGGLEPKYMYDFAMPPERTGASARRSGRRRCAAAASTRRASATRSPCGTPNGRK